MKHITLSDLQQLKGERPFSCLTAYDASTARIISTQGVEVILVGDSLGMVIQGHSTTMPVNLTDMVYHTHCVRRGNQGALLMSDMPFACHHNTDTAIEAGAALMRAGAQCIKIEGGAWLAKTIEHMRQCGIPVCAHLGLCPQSVHIYGGYKKQGTDKQLAEGIYQDALTLEASGAMLLLLESVPANLTHKITKKLRIPVIAIGAGPSDAQILVLQDVLGISENPPSFAKDFMQEAGSVSDAICAYKDAVWHGQFPQSFD